MLDYLNCTERQVKAFVSRCNREQLVQAKSDVVFRLAKARDTAVGRESSIAVQLGRVRIWLSRETISDEHILSRGHCVNSTWRTMPITRHTRRFAV